MERDGRITRFLLALVATLGTLCAVLAGALVWSRLGGVRLERLTVRDRLALVDDVERGFPRAFRTFLFSGTPGFYHMVPRTTYENVYGATFTTDGAGVARFQFTATQLGGYRVYVMLEGPGGTGTATATIDVTAAQASCP